MIDLILVSLDWLRSKDNKRTLGHSSLLAHCLKEGINVLPINSDVNSREFSKEELLDTILQNLNPHTVVGIGVYVWNESFVQWLLKQIRLRGFQNKIILGGPQISYSDIGIAALYPEADVFVRGYGEETLVSLITTPEKRFIPGVTYQNKADFGSISSPDLHDLTSPLLEGTTPLHPFIRWETQRGCIYRCSFCQHREAGRLKQNQFTMERIEAEIELLSSGVVRDIAILDPIFNNGDRETEILKLFHQYGYKGHLSLQCRFESLTPEFIEICSDLNVLLEFGLQTIHPKEMKAIHRRNNLRLVSQKIQQLQKKHIPFEVSLIYGLPNQTLSSFEQSIQWCIEQGIPSIQAFPLMLLRGTRLHKEQAKWSLVQNDDPIPVVIESDSFSHKEWLQMKALANSLQFKAQGAAK